MYDKNIAINAFNYPNNLFVFYSTYLQNIEYLASFVAKTNN